MEDTMELSNQETEQTDTWRAAMRALRPSTRIWYDALFPTTLLVVMAGLHVSWQTVLIAVASFALFHAGQNLFNDVADVAVDRASSETSRTGRPLVAGSLTRRSFLIGGWVMVLASLGLAAVLGLWSFVAMLALLPLTLAYNFEPIRLAGRPLATQVFWPLTWVLAYLFCAGAVDFEGWRRGVPFLVFLAIFMGIGEGLGQDLRDADNDRIGGRRTTVVVFGVGPTSVVAWLASLASVGVWIWFGFERGLGSLWTVLGVAVLAAWVVVSLPAVLRLLRRFEKADGRRMHVGPIYVFTAINLITLAAVVVG